MKIGDMVRINNNYSEEFLRGKVGVITDKGDKFWYITIENGKAEFLLKSEELDLISPAISNEELYYKLRVDAEAAENERKQDLINKLSEIFVDLRETNERLYTENKDIRAANAGLFDRAKFLQEQNKELKEKILVGSKHWMHKYYDLKKGIEKVLND
jgi:hypothetical protein